MMGRWVSISIAALFLCCSSSFAQQGSPDQARPIPFDQTPTNPNQPITPGMILLQNQQQQNTGSNLGLYDELDLLRRAGFAAARSATVSVRVLDRGGFTPPGLEAPDFLLIVNGKQRQFRLHGPSSKTGVAPAMVLLVFPPNDPVVHYIGVREPIALKYFSAQPAEVLPWNVGIFDSNGKMTPFTNGRSQLLAYLDEVGQTKEPFQYASDVTLPGDFRWEGPWLSKAETAISTMQHYEGPKVIVAMNPLDDWIYGLNDQMLEHAGPEALTGVAQHIGAHIYIGNVGGPDVIMPGGQAADWRPAQVNTAGGPQLGTSPSYHMQVDPAMNRALAVLAYRTSQMMLTSAATNGGFANSLKDLGEMIHRDLDGGYSLDCDMTAEDQDHGIPDVQIHPARHDLKVAILDVTPVGIASDTARAMNQAQVANLFRKAAAHPVTSPEFRITQRVDSFPIRDGLEPVLPMSSAVQWTGHGRGPMLISVAEMVEDRDLAHVILERELRVHWDGRSLSWERDSQLTPGHYAWSIAVHDGAGNIYAFSARNIDVDFPKPGVIGVSSLIVGKSCRDDTPEVNGLKRRPIHGEKEQTNLTIDPMRAGDCRLKPDTLGSFAATDTLHAFVRIYPPEKIDKGKPESWTAKFVLRSESGAVEATRKLAFTSDSGSGYLASIEMPLNAAGITGGKHTLEAEMRGPGIRHELKQSRQISIAALATPFSSDNRMTTSG